MATTIDFKVCGIPCQIEVLSYDPIAHGRFGGRPEDCYPDEGGESEWQLLDRNGYRAKWLENKMTDADREAVEQKVMDYMEGRKYD